MEIQELFRIILLGIVQGIAEFLPVSSSGHLVIVNELLSQDVAETGDHLAMNIALHLGTLGSILIVYRNELKQVLFDFKMIVSIIAATIPIVLVGLTLKDYIEAAFETPEVAAGGLLVTAGLLWLSEWIEPQKSEEPKSEKPPCLKQSLLIGAFQALAIIPGISRSGSTIAGGVMLGISRPMAAKFSFFIAIPAILGATVLHTRDLISSSEAAVWDSTLLIGGLTSFLVGIIALEWLLRLVRKKRLRWFAVYCLSVSLLTFCWLAMR